MGQGTFTAGDVEVFYHDTTNGDASIPLMVTSVTPIQPPGYVTDPTQNGVDGYTTFLVTFNPDKKPDGSASGITNYTGTYSYVVAPDNGQGSATPTPIAAPIWSFATARATAAGHQPHHGSQCGNLSQPADPDLGPRWIEHPIRRYEFVRSLSRVITTR